MTEEAATICPNTIWHILALYKSYLMDEYSNEKMNGLDSIIYKIYKNKQFRLENSLYDRRKNSHFAIQLTVRYKK